MPWARAARGPPGGDAFFPVLGLPRREQGGRLLRSAQPRLFELVEQPPPAGLDFGQAVEQGFVTDRPEQVRRVVQRDAHLSGPFDQPPKVIRGDGDVARPFDPRKNARKVVRPDLTQIDAHRVRSSRHQSDEADGQRLGNGMEDRRNQSSAFRTAQAMSLDILENAVSLVRDPCLIDAPLDRQEDGRRSRSRAVARPIPFQINGLYTGPQAVGIVCPRSQKAPDRAIPHSCLIGAVESALQVSCIGVPCGEQLM